MQTKELRRIALNNLLFTSSQIPGTIAGLHLLTNNCGRLFRPQCLHRIDRSRASSETGRIVEGLCEIVEGLCEKVEGLCGIVEGLCRCRRVAQSCQTIDFKLFVGYIRRERWKTRNFLIDQRLHVAAGVGAAREEAYRHSTVFARIYLRCVFPRRLRVP